MRKVFKQSREAILEIRLAGLAAGAFATFPVRQSVQALSGMKDDRRADAPTQFGTEQRRSGKHRHFMAEFMADVQQASALWLGI